MDELVLLGKFLDLLVFFEEAFLEYFVDLEGIGGFVGPRLGEGEGLHL
jgi:hypothetical protein